MKKAIAPVKRLMKGVMLKYVPGMITCAEFEQFIDDYLNNDLNAKEFRTFDWHLKLCRECRDYLEAYRHSIALGKKVFAAEQGETAVPDTVPEDLLQAMLEARNQK